MRKVGSPVYHPVNLDREYITGKALDRFSRQQAKVWRMLSSRQRAELRELFNEVIVSLQECLATGSPAYLADCACRADYRLTSRHFPEGITARSLAVMEDLVPELPADYRDRSAEFISAARAALGSGGCRSRKKRLSAPARALLLAAVAGDERRCEAIIDTALADRTDVPVIYEQIFTPVLRETGRLWERNEAGIAREHYVTALVSRLMERVYNRVPIRERMAGRPSVVTACVGGELHEVGIRMAAYLLRMDGWEVYHVGANTPARHIADVMSERDAGIAVLSVTMPGRLPDLDYLIRILRAMKKTNDLKIIVGGYPFLLVPELWEMIGADAAAGSAKEVPVIARRLVASKL